MTYQSVVAPIRKTLFSNGTEIVTTLQIPDKYHDDWRILTKFFAVGPHDVSGISMDLADAMKLHEELIEGIVSDGVTVTSDTLHAADCPWCDGKESLARRTRYYSYRPLYLNGVEGQPIIGDEDSEDTIDHDGPVDDGFVCTQCNYVAGVIHRRIINEATEVVANVTEVQS
jgi:hypothetical protein